MFPDTGDMSFRTDIGLSMPATIQCIFAETRSDYLAVNIFGTVIGSHNKPIDNFLPIGTVRYFDNKIHSVDTAYFKPTQESLDEDYSHLVPPYGPIPIREEEGIIFRVEENRLLSKGEEIPVRERFFSKNNIYKSIIIRGPKNIAVNQTSNKTYETKILTARTSIDDRIIKECIDSGNIEGLRRSFPVRLNYERLIKLDQEGTSASTD